MVDEKMLRVKLFKDFINEAITETRSIGVARSWMTYIAAQVGYAVESHEKWLTRTLDSTKNDYTEANNNINIVNSLLQKKENGETLSFDDLNILLVSSSGKNGVDGGAIGLALSHYNKILKNINEKLAAEEKKYQDGLDRNPVNENQDDDISVAQQENRNAIIKEYNEHKAILDTAKKNITKQKNELATLSYELSVNLINDVQEKNIINPEDVTKGLELNALQSNGTVFETLFKEKIEKFKKQDLINNYGQEVNASNRVRLTRIAKARDSLIDNIITPHERKPEDNIKNIQFDIQLGLLPESVSRRFKRQVESLDTSKKNAKEIGALAGDVKTISDVKVITTKIKELDEAQKNTIASLEIEASLLQNQIKIYKTALAKENYFGLSDPDAIDYGTKLTNEELKKLVVSSDDTENVDGGLIAQNLDYYTKLRTYIENELLIVTPSSPSLPPRDLERQMSLTNQLAEVSERIVYLKKMQSICCGILMFRTATAIEEKKETPLSIKSMQGAIKLHKKLADNKNFSSATDKFSRVISGGITGLLQGFALTISNDKASEATQTESQQQSWIDNARLNALAIKNDYKQAEIKDFKLIYDTLEKAKNLEKILNGIIGTGVEKILTPGRKKIEAAFIAPDGGLTIIQNQIKELQETFIN